MRRFECIFIIVYFIYNLLIWHWRWIPRFVLLILWLLASINFNRLYNWNTVAGDFSDSCLGEGEHENQKNTLPSPPPALKVWNPRRHKWISISTLHSTYNDLHNIRLGRSHVRLLGLIFGRWLRFGSQLFFLWMINLIIWIIFARAATTECFTIHPGWWVPRLGRPLSFSLPFSIRFFPFVVFCSTQVRAKLPPLTLYGSHFYPLTLFSW